MEVAYLMVRTRPHLFNEEENDTLENEDDQEDGDDLG